VSPLAPATSAPPASIAHFWKGVERQLPSPGDPSPHWPWHRSHRASGTPLTWFYGRLRSAAAVAYELTTGQSTSRSYLRRICKERDCVNPDHRKLEPWPEGRFRPSPALADALERAYMDLPMLCNAGHTLPPGGTRANCNQCKREREREALHNFPLS
jgi:hypothetical protein